MDKDNDKVIVVPETDESYEQFHIDFIAKGKPTSKPCIVATRESLIKLYSSIAVALITNKKDDLFSGMNGRFSLKRLNEGIVFGGKGIQFTPLYPKGDDYEYRLTAWVK